MSSLLASLEAAVSRLREVRDHITILHRELPVDWRLQYVGARRSLAECLGELYKILSSEPNVEIDSPRYVAFRKTLAELRAGLAHHQTIWPASIIDPAKPEYVQSFGSLGPLYVAVDRELKVLVDGSP